MPKENVAERENFKLSVRWGKSNPQDAAVGIWFDKNSPLHQEGILLSDDELDDLLALLSRVKRYNEIPVVGDELSSAENGIKLLPAGAILMRIASYKYRGEYTGHHFEKIMKPDYSDIEVDTGPELNISEQKFTVSWKVSHESYDETGRQMGNVDYLDELPKGTYVLLSLPAPVANQD